MKIWIASDGIEIAGDHWGNPSGPLVILQHGGGQTRHAWKNTGETLGNAGYHAIAFDARGHGDSGWAEPGHYGADFMVEDLRSVIKDLDGITPTVVGAAMGGGTSLIAIGEKKISAKALVLVDMAPRIEQEGQKQVQDFMDQCPNGFDSLDQVAEAIANYNHIGAASEASTGWPKMYVSVKMAVSAGTGILSGDVEGAQWRLIVLG